jgi:DNA-directed RNA polymerase specialized sigma24 family protein
MLLALSSRQRSAVVLRYFSDSSDNEIAMVLGCRPATVRSLIRRGLSHLREVM